LNQRPSPWTTRIGRDSSFVCPLLSSAFVICHLSCVAPRGLNILVNSEKVIRIVFCLYRCQPRIIAAIAVSDAILTFVHHEIDVSATGGIGMKSVPILSGLYSRSGIASNRCCHELFHQIQKPDYVRLIGSWIRVQTRGMHRR